jgi:hypothetical protein
MVFIQGDLYTTSGSTPLFNSWTPYVSKFDTSTFYNWEEDNVPLYDLEERTYELWEQQGFPTSSVPGFALSVSADAPTADLQANSRIFTTVSACIAALPKVIRFPVLIEVANYGDLGKLELHDFRVEETGSIEIINRNFVKDYTTSATIKSVGSTLGNTLITSWESANVSGTIFSGTTQQCQASALSISSTLAGAGGLPQLARFSAVNSVLYPQFTDRLGCLNVGIANTSAQFFPGTAYRFGINTYEAADTDNQLATNDVSATNQYTDARLLRGVITTSTKAGGCIYGNTLSKLSIHNCTGAIYVRNFFVDGEAAVGGGGRQNGIEVNNSEVVLENCTAVRCNNAGFYFDNSKVTLSRAAFAYRNYERPTAATREPKKGAGIQAFNSHITMSAVVSGIEPNPERRPPYQYNPGLDLGASGYDVLFSMSRNYVGADLHNTILDGGLPRHNATLPNSGGMFNLELNTGYGLLAKNSEMNIRGLLDIYGNNKGSELRNTNLQVEHLCIEDHTNEGMIAKNSDIIYNTFEVDGDPQYPGTGAGQQPRKQYDFRANGQHLVLRNQSSFELKRKNHLPEYYGHMIFSGSHGVANTPASFGFGVLPAISLESNSYANFIHATMYRAAAEVASKTVSPGMLIRATDSSEVELFGTKTGCTLLLGPNSYTKQQYVAGIAADNQSRLGIHGPTCIAQFGVDALAENNSVIDIGPPRIRDTYAVDASGFDLSSGANHTSVELHSTRACLVADNNSVLNMNDCGDYHNFWGEHSEGLTMLDLTQDYATGGSDLKVSSLVCNGSIQFYPNPQHSTGITANKLDDLSNAAGLNFTFQPFPTFTTKTRNNQYLITTSFLNSTKMATETLEDVTLGGVCVRAVKGSKANVTNVHFPVGTANSPLDGIYYNASGDTCSRLMIWNMADNSELRSSFTSVSGCYPADVGYHGPSSIWTSALGGVGGGSAKHIPASGAPSATPNTGVLSILDSFGRGSVSGPIVVPSGVGMNDPFDRYVPVSGNMLYSPEFARHLTGAQLAVSGDFTWPKGQGVYGASGDSYLNQGVFRVYFSPDSATKFIAHDAVGGFSAGTYPHGGVVDWEVGVANQVYAQGYNMSAACSAVVPTGSISLSSLYPNLLKISDLNSCRDGIPNALAMSGFYYCKEFLDDNPTQCMVDESGGNTFANIKNAALGGSGRPKRAIIYRSGNASTRCSEAYEGDSTHFPVKGFKSSNIFDLKRDN